MKKGFLSAPVLVLIAVIIVVVGIAVYLYLHAASQPQIPTAQPVGTSTVSQNSTSTIATSSVGTPLASSTQATTTIGVNSNVLPSCMFSANPMVIVTPEITNLWWSCKNVNVCSITSNEGNNFPNQNSIGTLSVKPSALPISYTLNCNGINGATSSDRVIVTPPGSYNGDPGQP
jgi:hypothetical protein